MTKYAGFAVLEIESHPVLVASDWSYHELPPHFVDENGVVYNADGSLCSDQEFDIELPESR